jgi:hypothetical protein
VDENRNARDRRSISREEDQMYRVRVVTPRYEQSRPYAGQVGEVIGHWGPESNEHGRDGYLVQFPDGRVVGVADDEVEAVMAD